MSFAQEVIADAEADWFNYKRECRDNDEAVDKNEIKKHICDAMAKHYKGINPFQVKDFAYLILYKDGDYKDYVLSRIQI